MAHIDPDTGQLVTDDNDGPDISAYSAPPDLGDGGGDQSYAPNPAYLAQVLGSVNPEERASGATGLNYTPGFTDPRFHDWTQNLMTANEVQPQVDRMAAFQQMINQQFPETPPAQRHKTPALAYILGGLQDALSLGSMLRKPGKMTYYTGRHGAGGKPVKTTVAYERARIPSQMGGTAAALFAPMIRQQQDQRVVDRQNFMRRQQIAAEMARYAGSAAMRPPAAPRESPIAAGYRTMKVIAQETGHPEIVDAWVKWVAHADPRAKASLEQQAQDAKARGDKATYDSIMGTIKDVATARQRPGTGPKTPEQIAAEAQARTTGNLQGQLGFAQQAGVLPPNVAAAIKRARAPHEAKIAAAQRVLDALMKARDKAVTDAQANPLGEPVNTAAFDDQIRKQQQVIENLGWAAQQAEDQVRTNLRLSFGARQMTGLDTGAEEGPMSQETSFGGATPDIMDMLPAGVEPSQIVLSNGHTAADYTPERLSKMSEEELTALQDEIDAAYGNLGQ